MAKTANKKMNPEKRKARARKEYALRICILIICIALAFVGGFAFRSQTALVASLGFPISSVEKAGKTTAATKTIYNSISERLDEVETMLDEGSVYGFDLNKETDLALQDLSKASDDPYMTYYDSNRYATLVKESASKNYSGIGVLLSDQEGKAYVIDVLEGSVAAENGVKQGDIVIGIDGDSSHDWSVSEAVNSFARGNGQTVVVTWLRPSTSDAKTGNRFTTTLTCSEYTEPNVVTELVDGCGYIQLKQVTSNAATLVGNAVRDLMKQGAKSFVLDLRDNPGGYLTQAVDVASVFEKSGVIVQIVTASGSTNKIATGNAVTDAPLVVLVNEYTSAAAEVIAGGLQDNERCTVVGKTTKGKGSVQVLRELSFGGAIRYTAAFYKTPLGSNINEQGINPNIRVGADSTAEAQKNLAIETAQSLIRQ